MNFLMVFDFNQFCLDGRPGNEYFWISHKISDLLTPLTPLGTHGCASAVFAENVIWNRLKRFLPVCRIDKDKINFENLWNNFIPLTLKIDKNWQKLTKKLTKNWQKLIKTDKNWQKLTKKLSKNWQKTDKKLSKICQKSVKKLSNWQKLTNTDEHWRTLTKIILRRFARSTLRVSLAQLLDKGHVYIPSSVQFDTF